MISDLKFFHLKSILGSLLDESRNLLLTNLESFCDRTVYTTSISKLDRKEIEEETKKLYYFDKKLEEFVEK